MTRHGPAERMAASNRDAAGSQQRDARRGCVTVRHLTVGYRERAAVEDVSGVFAAGSLTAIIGANGAGKTTLLHAIAGLVAAPGVHRDLGGETPRRSRLSAQSDSIDRDFPISVLEFAALGSWARIGVVGRAPPELRPRVMNALRTVGLDDLAGSAWRALGRPVPPHLFARVIVQDAAIVLLDEPFAGVDAATSGDLLALMERWHADGRTVVVALHDLDQVLATFPDTLLLARKAIAWGKTATALVPEKLIEAGMTAPTTAGSRPQLAMRS